MLTIFSYPYQFVISPIVWSFRKICAFESFCENNNLFINITFTCSKKSLLYQHNTNDIILNRCDEVKNHRVIFDSKMLFNHHINRLISSTFKTHGFVTNQFTNTKAILLLCLVKINFFSVRGEMSNLDRLLNWTAGVLCI